MTAGAGRGALLKDLTLGTIRIYKVAEVLGLPSQEVIDQLRRDHGIEVSSASSTVEEIVGRQFAARIARERGIELPSGPLFADTPARRPAARRGRLVKTKAEPPQPARPTLGPPRLIKSAKAARAAAKAEAEAEAAAAAATEAEQADADETPGAQPPVGPAVEVPAAPAATVVPDVPAPPAPAQPQVLSPSPATVIAKPTGRVAPPTLRLRLEEPKPPKPAPAPAAPASAPPAAAAAAPPAAATATPPAAAAATPPAAAAATPPAAAAAAPPVAAAASAPPVVARTPVPGRMPPAVRTPPAGARMPGMGGRPPLGGPRPLPSQPVRPPSSRPPSSRPLPPRPAVGYRPPPRPHRPHGRRSDRRARQQAPRVPLPPPPITRTITLAEGMTVKDLADRLDVKAKEVLKKLIEKRLMMTINTTLDTETATMIAREFGADVKMRTFEEEMVVLEAEVTSPEDLVSRAPVVTVMGHVDHGKTTLLDAIRETRVAEGEAGGITQHIGAYAVEINRRRIVFLDTPGHEAFTTMRARGASVTDVVVLVVAADDGVMPQTQEAIDHARAANVPILVAINKIDKADANPDRVKNELAERDLAPEEWGGQTVMVPVSAKRQENLELLLEMILLVTEMGEHKANPKRTAAGAVLEAKVDRGRGPVATILVQDGTLRVGDNFIAGTSVGRVRALIDDRAQQVKEVEPSSPVEVLGLTSLPQPGDTFQVVADAAKARQIALLRQTQAKEKALGSRGTRLTLESLQQQFSEGEAKELPIIIKADVQGSAEVLAESLAKLGDERVKIRIIHTGVGAVSEWDVLLASTSKAIIIGFNVRPDRNAAVVAEREGVDIRKHSVIYNVTDEVKKAMSGLLEPTKREQQLGLAEVREVFKVPKFGAAAGCLVTEGRITRAGHAQARLVRDGVVVHEGRIGSIRRFKDDVNEVKSGIECGIAFEKFADIKVGDVIESFTVETVAATV